MPFSDPFSSANYAVRPYAPGDEAGMFTVSASLNAAEASDLLGWTAGLETTLDVGGAAWVAARGKRVGGYVILSPVPGLLGLYELSGGVAPPWQLRGIGTRLLDTVKQDSSVLGAQRLSCLVTELESDTGQFLLHRDFYIEHEECLLELDLNDRRQEMGTFQGLSVETLPQEEATARFLRVYEDSFRGTPWSQPFCTNEVTALLEKPEDLLFAVQDGENIGVAWIETGLGGYGRIEPFGIVAENQGFGYGRWLLEAALRRLQARGLEKAQLGLWRTNTAAMNLYKRAGFVEVSNWYYLAYDLRM